MTSVAIIGTGIAGMGCGHFLHRTHRLSFYERNDYVGGHTNTVTVDEEGRSVPIDTGFMVFNRVTYPHLTRLFTELGVPVKPTSMSFSVRHAESGLEFAGSSLNHLFAQRRNLLLVRGNQRCGRRHARSTAHRRELHRLVLDEASHMRTSALAQLRDDGGLFLNIGHDSACCVGGS